MKFPDLSYPPNAIYFLVEGNSQWLVAQVKTKEGDFWEGHGVQLEMSAASHGGRDIQVTASVRLREVALRWESTLTMGTLILGDAWERSYGELEWRGWSPHRVMPWYFLASSNGLTAGYGVQTGGGSLAFWEVDADGITLRLDVRSGGIGVALKSRQLLAATLRQRLPHPGETPYEAAHAFCRSLCPKALMPTEPVVGHNDWYWLYGKNSEKLILEATRRFLDLYPADLPVRPWSIIDDGWQAATVASGPTCNGGPWDRGNPAFPDMPGLARKIKSLGARPGIWMRPLLSNVEVPHAWKLQRPGVPTAAFVLDPTVPEVQERIYTDISRLRDWGYEMIKHDFSTFDLSGRWGPEMNQTRSFTSDGWTFADSSLTTAEVLLSLYRNIRKAAGPSLLIGCNVVGHLAAGLIEIQRIGDDTSATDWDRTRRMGVNTLAFRSVQHGAFFAADADCVPISPHIRSNLTKAWLNLISGSGTPLFLSIDPTALNESVTADIRGALRRAAQKMSVAEPIDWFDTGVPAHWRLQGNTKTTHFGWSEWSPEKTIVPAADNGGTADIFPRERLQASV